jgi:hypothetical protein
VRFVDLLRTAVMLSAGAATMLAIVTVLGATRDADDTLVLIGAGWWVAAGLIGTFVGRRDQVSQPIGRVLADAHTATMMPEHRPGAVVFNRLWPLLLSTAAAAVAGIFFAQVPMVAAGFAIIWALAWRRQDAAVVAIEERDGSTFYVERTSPVRPIRLVRTPGFRRETPTMSSISGTG